MRKLYKFLVINSLIMNFCYNLIDKLYLTTMNWIKNISIIV